MYSAVVDCKSPERGIDAPPLRFGSGIPPKAIVKKIILDTPHNRIIACRFEQSPKQFVVVEFCIFCFEGGEINFELFTGNRSFGCTVRFNERPLMSRP